MHSRNLEIKRFPISLYKNVDIETRQLVLEYLDYWHENYYTETYKKLTTVRGDNAFQPKAFKMNFGKYRRLDEEDEYFEPLFTRHLNETVIPNLIIYFDQNFDGPFEHRFIKYCEFKMWVVELGPDAYQCAHLHTTQLTNSWYVLTDPEAGSTIWWIDHLNNNLSNCFRKKSDSILHIGFQPEDGQSAMFPGDLIHHIDKNNSSGRRISVNTDFSMCIGINEIYD